MHRKAAFNEVEAQFVQFSCDQQLVLQREVDSLSLAAISKRRVVDLDTGHRGPRFWRRSNKKILSGG